jgi:hypothetical protein
MAKHEIGEIVWYMEDGKGQFARIVGREGRKYRIFTAARRQLRVDAQRLRDKKPVVLILESSLSDGRDGLRTDKRRQSGVFLEEFFKSMGYLVLHERVHTAKSLEHFMRFARTSDVVVVHWSGHGNAWGSGPWANRPTGLFLSAEPLYLPGDSEEYLKSCLERGMYRKEQLTKGSRKIIQDNLLQYALIDRIFSGLKEKILVFSTCEIGKPKGLAEFISRVSGAKAVITYDGFVADREANVIEALLYFRLLTMETKQRTSGRIVEEVRESMRQSLGQRIPLVCYRNGSKGG